MKESIQFIQISPEEHEERIYRRIKGEFEQLKKDFQPKEPTEYLTRNEVKELLKVDLSTIHNLQKKGKLSVMEFLEGIFQTARSGTEY